ncbi:hypothetical protein BDY21DRAFT_89447 [Lineolata rhizophorae]|uniref:MICOS complex subunit MIC12 n=1 Tax=Lineolata rhizophorae TaxID=578093 RepID=A0A6A6PC56_9PEZI|nr:hypothetical protein BDY21DRAFT_89447 [Lineolata rhizophorae]
MGFTTGFLGGFTLTTSLLYLTIALHRNNRVSQALALRQSSQTLNDIVEPPPALPPPPSARVARPSLVETAKDKWNAEVETLVRKVYDTDWNQVREQAEDNVGAVWRKIKDLGKETKEEGEKR